MSEDINDLAKYTTSAALNRPELRAAAARMDADQFEGFLIAYLADNAASLTRDGVILGTKAINAIADKLTGLNCRESSEYDRIHLDRFARLAHQALVA